MTEIKATEAAATTTTTATTTAASSVMAQLILKRASTSRSSGQWRDDDYDVLENGVVVGRIFHSEAAAPEGRPWMWASGHGGIKRAALGYEPREGAMAALRASERNSRHCQRRGLVTEKALA